MTGRESLNDDCYPRIIREAAEVTAEIEEAVCSTVDWFEDGPMPTDEFIDRLCDSEANGWELDSYDSPAARKIMRIARAERKERQS